MEGREREELLTSLRSVAETLTEPDGKELNAVSFTALQALALQVGVSMRDLEKLSLQEGIIPRRYLRNLGTIGREGQLRMLEARAAVFGQGGLGGTISELLARMGIGGLVLVDGDRFSDDNLNRQILSDTANLGAWKAATAAQHISAVNPAVECMVLNQRVGRAEMEEALAGCDVAVDALDNIPSRLELQEACAARGVPFVHGAIAGFAGQVMTVFPGDAGLCLLYQGDQEHGIEIATGNPASTPAVVAALQVSEVVKIIVGPGELLRNRILFLDTETNFYEITDMS
jgi:molybdopterin/thiamine biosynthesis adenylyltransferase